MSRQKQDLTNEDNFQKKSIEPDLTPLVQAIATLRNESIRVGSELEVLQDKQATIAALLNAMGDEIWYCDPDGDLLYTNIAAQQWLEEKGIQSIIAWLGTTKIWTIDGKLRDREETPLLRALHGEDVRSELERRFHAETGKYRFYEVNAIPVRDHGGQIMGAVANCRDVTERYQAQQQTQVLHDLLMSLSPALTVQHAAKAILQQGLKIFGGTAGFITFLSATGNEASIVAQTNLPADFIQTYHRANDVAVPSVAQAAFTGRATWGETPQEYAHQLPDVYRQLAEQLGYSAILSLPLNINSTIVGSIVVLFPEPTVFSSEERLFYEIVASYCAQALHRAQLHEEKINLAVEQQRLQTARDLHDGVTQALFTSSILAEVLQRNFTDLSPDILQRHSEKIAQLNRGALAQMRNLLLELRPEQWESMTIQEVIRLQANAVMGNASLQIILEMPDQPLKVPANTLKHLTYMIQEALHNIVKHAQATLVTITLERQPDRVVLKLSDNGQGFQPEVKTAGMGLNTLRERAAEINAELELFSSPSGTRITISLPDTSLA